jgi:hypothetical protein
MVAAYWQIGRRIVEEEQGGSAKSTYGDRRNMAGTDLRAVRRM